jgi:hypothetical protein
MNGSLLTPTETGSHHGSLISPILANLYKPLDAAFAALLSLGQTLLHLAKAIASLAALSMTKSMGTKLKPSYHPRVSML